MKQLTPLTSTQEQLWFDCVLHPESDMYVSSYVFALEGSVDVEVLWKSWQKILKRHAALRTYFGEEKGVPWQAILENCDSNKVFKYLDLSNLEVTNALKKVDEILSNKIFLDLKKWPLHHLILFKIKPKLFKLVIFIHHILVDYNSFNLLLKEFGDIYDNKLFGKEITLPKIDSTIFDYYKKEKIFFSKFKNKMQDYWSEMLLDCSPLNFKKSEQKRISSAKREFFKINTSIFEDLQKIARRQETTFFSVFAACYFVLLHGITQQTDITIAYPSGRRLPGFNFLAGFFINNLPLRVRLDSKKNFFEVLENISNFMRRPGYHDYLPTYEIMKLVRNNIKFSEQAFDNIFSSANFAINSFRLRNIKVTSELTQVKEASKSLLFLFDNQGDDIRCAFEYRKDLYSKKEILYFIELFKNIVKTVAKNPDLLIENILNKHVKPFSFSWSLGEKKEVKEKTVVDMIENRARDSKENVALIFGDKKINYQELNSRINQAARYLKEIGVREEKIVALKQRRGIEQLIWILAVLKAGAAFLPIDPSYPDERQKYILKDSKATLLLTDEPSLGIEEPFEECVVIQTPLLTEILSTYSNKNLGTHITKNNLAYVIYTSGSTGKPKGVMIEHESLANLHQVQSQLFNVKPENFILQFSSIGFDGAVWEWVFALSHGSTLILIENNQNLTEMNPLDLQNLSLVTTATLPSSLARVLPVELFPKLETLIVVGEICDNRIIDKWASKVKLFNGYGPTEDTVCSTIFLCNTAYPAGTIGKPVVNGEVYILGEDKRPVSEGEIGELYLGGAGLARGYLNRTELTAEKFIIVDIKERGKVRLYKSGDMGRWIGGYVEYIGRKDEQIKVRGYRVELGEIEEVIKQTPNVCTALVLAEGKNPYHIAAYIVADRRINEESLREEIKIMCQNLLPNYMVPNSFTILTELPLTVHGKVDRKTLTFKRREIEKNVTNHVRSKTEQEKLLEILWCQLLGVERVGMHDSFFELGGDSIISIQLVSTLRSRGFKLEVKDIFESPNISSLSLKMKRIEKESNSTRFALGEKTLSLAPVQRWFFEQNFYDKNYYNQILLTEPVIRLEEEIVTQVCSAIQEHHDVFRVRFLLEGKADNFQSYISSIEQKKQLENCKVYSLKKEDMKSKISEISFSLQSGINLEKGPIFRAALFNIENGEQRILFIIHHLYIDTVSWNILLDDFEKGYQQIARGNKINLDDATSSYQSWSQFLVSCADSEIFSKDIPYWKKQVQDIRKWKKE